MPFKNRVNNIFESKFPKITPVFDTKVMSAYGEGQKTLELPY